VEGGFARANSAGQEAGNATGKKLEPPGAGASGGSFSLLLEGAPAKTGEPVRWRSIVAKTIFL
jgi:hypothetical protein